MATGDSPAANPFRQGQAIGGWLVFVALGLVFTPLRRGYEAVRDYRIIASQHPDLIGSAWFWSVYSIEALLLTFNLVLLPLFFLRKSVLPFAIQAYLATCVVGMVAMQTLSYLLVESEFDIKSLAQMVITAVIWISYFQFSKRVEATFVR
ncbi:MAG TPA: DUF2569 family protein [Planctomycetota bacterium]|nr:DUF2569 family protein [Planctomycetota bacterium]